VAGDDVIEVEPTTGRDPQPLAHSPTTPDPDGDRIVAETIADYPGPVFERDDQYDGGGGPSAHAMAQAHVFRLVTDRSFHELSLCLENHHQVRGALGIDTVLKRSALQRSWKKQFGEVREYLREYADWIEEELEKLDAAVVDPYLPNEQRQFSDHGTITDPQKRRCVGNVWGMIEDDLDFDRGPGIEWSTEYLYDLFAEGAIQGVTPYEVLDKPRKESEDISHKAAMNAAGQRSAEEWIDVFDSLFQTLFERLHALGWFNRPVDAYVDATPRPMWPSGELPKGVKGGDVKESTNYAWQFATLVVKDRGIQVPVAIVPITDEVRPPDQLEQLLERAGKRVNIDVLLADGAYAGARSKQVIKDSPVVNDYIVRGTRGSDDVKRKLVRMTGRFDDGGTHVTVSADKQVRSESRVVADPDWKYATEEYLNRVPGSPQQGLSSFNDDDSVGSIDLDDVDKKLWQCRRPYYTSLSKEEASAQEVCEKYNNRWVVEDNYANTKRNQLGKTDSPDHAVQTFVFCLGMLFSVAWTACRVFLREDYPEAVQENQTVISAREILVFVRLEYG